MALPLVPILYGLVTAGIGAFIGAQVDDKLEPPIGVPATQNISFSKIALYSGTALVLVWGARKAGLLKKVG